MASTHSNGEDHPLPEVNTGARDERSEILDDIRLAEVQVARGEAVEHQEAFRQVVARFGRGIVK